MAKPARKAQKNGPSELHNPHHSNATKSPDAATVAPGDLNNRSHLRNKNPLVAPNTHEAGLEESLGALNGDLGSMRNFVLFLMTMFLFTLLMFCVAWIYGPLKFGGLEGFSMHLS